MIYYNGQRVRKVRFDRVLGVGVLISYGKELGWCYPSKQKLLNYTEVR